MRGRSLYLAVTVGLISPPLAQGTAQVASANETEPASRTTISHGIETGLLNDGTVLKVDRTGKGAVLCIQGIDEAIAAFGKTCQKGKDRTFQAELDRSLSRIDAFIGKNSPDRIMSTKRAERSKVGLEELRRQDNFCTGDLARLYAAMRKEGVSQLRLQTDELLSVPREPVMNPCL